MSRPFTRAQARELIERAFNDRRYFEAHVDFYTGQIDEEQFENVLDDIMDSIWLRIVTQKEEEGFKGGVIAI